MVGRVSLKYTNIDVGSLVDEVSAKKPYISLENIYKSFGSVGVCKGFSLSVNKGETLSIMGPSGVGKTVTLKLLVGLLLPDAGQIFYDGLDYDDFKSEESFLAVRKRIAMVFQGAALFDSINVFENIAYPLRVQSKLQESEIEEKVQEKLAWVDLPGAALKMPSELSGGMRKRIGLARAIITEPEVLLYDEPTAGLDPINTARITDLIISLNERLKNTSLVVTHDIPFVKKLSATVAFVYDGKVVTTGDIDALMQSENGMVRGFMQANPELVDAYLKKERA